MRVSTLAIIAFILTAAGVASAAEFQGMVVDWRCAKLIVQNGKEKTFKNDRSCSLMHHYQRQAYGLITDDKKYYYLSDPQNEHILQLLQGNPDKDDLKVVVTGDLNGNTIKVTNISML